VLADEERYATAGAEGIVRPSPVKQSVAGSVAALLVPKRCPMRRTVQSFMAIGLILFPALASRAGDDAAAGIVDKAIKAYFPKGVDTKNTASRTKSKGTLHVAGLDLDFTQQVFVQAPDKFKEVMELTVMGKQVTVTTVFNGKEGWIRADDKDIKVTDEILEELREAAYAMRLTQGLFLKDKALKLMSVGESKVKGKDTVGVRVSRDGKKDITLFFDKTTHLIAKVEMRKRDIMSGQEVNEERFITEYQDVSGRKVAKKVEVLRDGNQLLEAEVMELQILPKLDDGEFVQPK
jgi:hypothetical protein